MDQPTEPLAYFIDDFCERFVISKTFFYREVRGKRLRMFKRGKRSLIERAEDERWYANLINHASQGAGVGHCVARRPDPTMSIGLCAR